MASANQGAPIEKMDWLLAGLQAGVLGSLAMLAWLGVNAIAMRRGFWTAANLMSTVFYGENGLRAGFARHTVAGLAFYLLVYGALGMAFAMAAGGRARGVRMLLVALVAALAWYYLWFDLILAKMAPLVSLLHAEHPTMLGHLVYGSFLAGVPRLLPPPPAPPMAAEPLVDPAAAALSEPASPTPVDSAAAPPEPTASTPVDSASAEPSPAEPAAATSSEPSSPADPAAATSPEAPSPARPAADPDPLG
jgi:hypothetical protein